MIPPEMYLWHQTVIGSSSTIRTSLGSGAVTSVNSEGPVLNYSTLPAGRAFARQTSAMRFATSVAAATSGATASTVSWPAMVPSIFRPLTLSRTLETAPAVPSRVWITTWFCAGTRPRTKLGRTSIPAEPGSCGSARYRLPTLRTPSSARSRLTVACATSTPSSASALTTSCWVPRSRSEIKRKIRSCLVVLSTCVLVAAKTVLLLEVLEPEVLLVTERQVHVLYRRPRGALEQVVDSGEEQELPGPTIYRSREPAPVGVRHVRDVRVLLPRLHESPLLVVLRVPAEDLPRPRHVLDVDHDGLELPPRYRDEVRNERDLGHLADAPQHPLDLRRVPVPRRPISVGTLVHAHEVRLDVRLGPGPAHPGKSVDGNGPYPIPHSPNHRSERQNSRRRIATGVGDEPPLGNTKDLGQPVMRLREKLGRRMLPIPLHVSLLIREPEVCREVYYQAGPRLQQLLHRAGALAVPVGHEGHVEVGGFDLLRSHIDPVDRELRIDLPDPSPRVPARRNTQSPDLGMTAEQPHEFDPRVPTPAMDADLQSHGAHFRTSGYLFKFLHKLVDALMRGCENTPPW